MILVHGIRLGVTPASQSGIYVVNSAKGVLIVKLSTEGGVLVIFGCTDILVRTACFLTIFLQVDNHVLSVHICPGRLVNGIVELVSLRVVVPVVDTESCLEAQSLDPLVEVGLYTHIKGEGAGVILHVAGSKRITKESRLVIVVSTQQILTIEHVEF